MEKKAPGTPENRMSVDPLTEHVKRRFMWRGDASRASLDPLVCIAAFAAVAHPASVVVLRQAGVVPGCVAAFTADGLAAQDNGVVKPSEGMALPSVVLVVFGRLHIYSSIGPA